MSGVPPPPPPLRYVSKNAMTASAAAVPSAPAAASTSSTNRSPPRGPRSPTIDQLPPTRSKPQQEPSAQLLQQVPHRTPPAGWPSPHASDAPSPPASIMKKKSSPTLKPTTLNASGSGHDFLTNPVMLGAATSSFPGNSSSYPPEVLVVRQQVMIEELLRENRHLQQRIAQWLGSTDAIQADISAKEAQASLKHQQHQTTSSSARGDGGDLPDTAGETIGESPNPSSSPTIESFVNVVLDESTPPSLLLARIHRLELALQLECLERDDAETKIHVQQRMIAHLMKRL